MNMDNDYTHSIPESSCFFQGHTGQYFSRKYGKYLSFQIGINFEEYGADFNFDKYKPIFSKIINQKIALRKMDGGNFHEINQDDLTIQAIRLVADESEGFSGSFRISPATAICKMNNCNQYYELDKGRKCGHIDSDPWEQITFLAFCDVCGWRLPLHYMTNIYNDCKKCGGTKTLRKLIWPKGRDNIGSYKVACTKCGKEEGLFFMECRHENKSTGEILSTKKPKKFRGVPTRAGVIVHPLVITIPDLSIDDNSKRKNVQEKVLSESFVHFFGFEFEESKMSLPEFKENLLKKHLFFDLRKIKSLFEEICDDLEISIESPSLLNQTQFQKLIHRVLKRAKERIDDGASEDKTTTQYGIQFIKDALNSISNFDFSENDLQCANLLDSYESNLKTKPKCDLNFQKLCDKFGLKLIHHYSDLTMLQALLGIIEGSTRKDPMLFRVIESGKKNNKKATVYIRDFSTEGILFQLDVDRILKWLQDNKNCLNLENDLFESTETDTYTHFRSLMFNNDSCKKAVKTLLHTYSHMLIQQSTIDTGLDIQSLAEIICPYTGSIFIYSTNSINIGGLEFTYDYHLVDWFSRVQELAEDCPQDPACMFDEGGACNSCSYIPEFVCYNFNQELDRSSLIGGSDRFNKGYLG